jgi:Ion channel
MKRNWSDIAIPILLVIFVGVQTQTFFGTGDGIPHDPNWLFWIAIICFGCAAYTVIVLAISNWYSVYLLAIGLVAVVWSFIINYAIIFRILGLSKSGVAIHDPINCLYFSIITWTTVGYGDLIPSDDARLWAASEAMVGYLVMIIFIGTFAKIIKATVLASNSEEN